MEERARLKLKETNLDQTNNSEDLKDIPVEPFRTICDYCSKKVTTCVKKEYNLALFPYAIIIIYFYGFFYGSIIMLVTFSLFQNITHICPECFCEITYKSFYPIKQKGEYFSLNFGGFIIVLKKIYIYIIIFFILIFGIYFNIINYNKVKENKKHLVEEFERNDESLIKSFYNSTDTTLTWETLIKECGSKVMIENSVRAKEIFNKKYFRKIVQWKGYFINAFIHKLSQLGMADPGHLVNINIRMVPSETLKTQDLLLSMGKDKFLKHFDLLKKMKTGTPVEFKAEFESIGDEWRPHHLHLIWINITDDFMKDKVNITLFKGVNFDIKGHIKLKDEVEKISEEMKKNETKVINEGNKTN